MTDLTDRELVVALVALVNATGALPVAAKGEYLEPDAPSASVQKLPGARWAERYIDGGGIRETPFAVNYRTDSRDSAGRADAAAAMLALATALEALTDADLDAPMLSIQCVTTPAISERGDDGSEVWTDEYLLQSKHSG